VVQAVLGPLCCVLPLCHVSQCHMSRCRVPLFLGLSPRVGHATDHLGPTRAFRPAERCISTCVSASPACGTGRHRIGRAGCGDAAVQHVWSAAQQYGCAGRSCTVGSSASCRVKMCLLSCLVQACRLRPCAGAVAEGAWEKPRRPHHASLQPVPARRKSGARRACLAPDQDTLCTRTGGDAREHAAHGHGGASSVQERGRRGWVPTVCWWWRGGAPAEALRRSVPRLLYFVMDVGGCVS